MIRKIYHLVNWKNVCLPKYYAGLDLLDLESMNKACAKTKYEWVKMQ
jgi:hypothetical protein